MFLCLIEFVGFSDLYLLSPQKREGKKSGGYQDDEWEEEGK